MEERLEKFCLGPAALGQNMLIADGIVEVTCQTLIRLHLTPRMETLSSKFVHVYMEMSKATFPMSV